MVGSGRRGAFWDRGKCEAVFFEGFSDGVVFCGVGVKGPEGSCRRGEVAGSGGSGGLPGAELGVVLEKAAEVATGGDFFDDAMDSPGAMSEGGWRGEAGQMESSHGGFFGVGDMLDGGGFGKAMLTLIGEESAEEPEAGLVEELEPEVVVHCELEAGVDADDALVEGSSPEDAGLGDAVSDIELPGGIPAGLAEVGDGSADAVDEADFSDDDLGVWVVVEELSDGIE